MNNKEYDIMSFVDEDILDSVKNDFEKRQKQKKNNIIKITVSCAACIVVVFAAGIFGKSDILKNNPKKADTNYTENVPNNVNDKSPALEYDSEEIETIIEDENGEVVEGYELTDSSSETPGTSEQIVSDRKVIENLTFRVETKTFDKFIEDIEAMVKQMGGYVESSENGGNDYYKTNTRTAKFKIRIPKTAKDDFSAFLSNNSNVISKEVNTDDATDKYVDTQSRIKALEIERDTLENLLEKATSVDDMMNIYERLTNVIAEIESYQGKLNKMDNMADYATFTVYVNEVKEKVEAAKEKKVEDNQNWFEKTWNGFKYNIYRITKTFLDGLSSIISALPYLLLLGVVVVVVVIIIRRRKNGKRIIKRKDKNNK